jgi:hypothetical protein
MLEVRRGVNPCLHRVVGICHQDLDTGKQVLITSSQATTLIILSVVAALIAGCPFAVAACSP